MRAALATSGWIPIVQFFCVINLFRDIIVIQFGECDKLSGRIQLNLCQSLRRILEQQQFLVIFFLVPEKGKNIRDLLPTGEDGLKRRIGVLQPV